MRCHKAAALSLMFVAAPAAAHAGRLSAPLSAYLTHCGGCHGVEGRTGSSGIPALRDTVGSFACTPEGRDYLIRVPGVSMSLIRDDRLMADVMNFVLFTLGGSSTRPGTKPYTPADIRRLRADPINTPDLMFTRAQVLGRSLQQCAAATKRPG